MFPKQKKLKKIKKYFQSGHRSDPADGGGGAQASPDGAGALRAGRVRGADSGPECPQLRGRHPAQALVDLQNLQN